MCVCVWARGAGGRDGHLGAKPTYADNSSLLSLPTPALPLSHPLPPLPPLLPRPPPPSPQVGTPRTHRRFLNREDGTYGPIPSRRPLGMLSMPFNTTDIPGLYCVGDSAFPGQVRWRAGPGVLHRVPWGCGCMRPSIELAVRCFVLATTDTLASPPLLLLPTRNSLTPHLPKPIISPHHLQTPSPTNAHHLPASPANPFTW